MPALRRVEAQTPPAQKPVAKQSDRESVKPATNMATEQRSGQGGTAGGSVFVKVLSLVAGPGGTDEDDVQISEMPISTLQFASYAHISTPYLSWLEQVLTIRDQEGRKKLPH